MSPPAEDPNGPQARLVDTATGPARTTATLLGSLAARLTVLHLVTGADAVGAMTAGLAALGRETAATAEGARMLEAIEAGAAGTNGDAVWDALRIGEWASTLPPTPVLDHLRNDLALLLARDLADVLELPVLPPEPRGAEGGPAAEPATFAHYLLGVWAMGRELVFAVETLVAPTLSPAGRVVTGTPPAPEVTGPLLQ